MHAQRIHPGLSLCHHLQPEHPPLCVDSHLTSVSSTNALARAQHTHIPGSGRVYETRFRWYVRSPPSSPSAAAALPLFLSGRPFTIGNLHKRLTEARLNHTREREKNRRASEVFVRGGARVCVPGAGAEQWKRQRKRKKAEIARGETAVKLGDGRERRSGEVVGRGRREGARRWRRKFTTRRPPELPDATTEAPRSLPSRFPRLLCSLPPPLPSRPAHQVHLRNNTWYTVPRSPAYPGYALYTVHRNNVTDGLVADHCSTSSFISPSRARQATDRSIDLWIRRDVMANGKLAVQWAPSHISVEI